MKGLVSAIWVAAMVVMLAACSSSGGSDKPGADVGDSPGDTATGEVGESDIQEAPDVAVPGEDVAPDKVCEAQCQGKECGSDGCGGSCGECAADVPCSFEGKCIVCTPDCADKECGSDTCGGFCGECPEGVCVDGECVGEPIQDCGDIFDCLAECDPNDEACQQNCINSAPIEWQMAFNELYECMIEVDYWACWDICPDGEDDPGCDKQALNDCFEEKMGPCEEQFVVCFPPGTWTCKEGWICVVTCPEGDEECPQECLAELSSMGQELWNAFIDCLDENGYFPCFDLPEDEQEACLAAPWDTCQPFLSACASGDKNCKDIWDCMDTCSPIDDLCPYECLYDGTPEAQAAYFTLLDCVIEQCGDQPSQECFNSALDGSCGSLYNDCIAE